ncbi:MAG: hypothetical protein JW974_01745 [Alphaproteobacteria bacterium]|nr:hypothetical protein [Alphaproteobacteria bacterium]MBN2675504.1 hypothetical protein [Alphaproteobacteria bacterium]
MNLVLMGTNDWVVPIFDRIADQHNVLAVFTRAPKPSGRKLQLQNSPVHNWAESRGLPVVNDIKEYNYKPDMVIVISYGVILRDNVLGSAPVINIHPSLLPKYRGPSPIRSAIMNGDTETGVCLMQVTPKVDAGDIYMMQKLEIGENDTNEIILKKVSDISADMLSEYLRNPEMYPPKPQVGEPFYTKKITAADTIIDWGKPPIEIHNKVRSIGGRTKINDSDLKILKTRINEDGRLEILRVHPAGKKPMSWHDFLNGHQWIKAFGFHNVAL